MSILRREMDFFMNLGPTDKTNALSVSPNI